MPYENEYNQRLANDVDALNRKFLLNEKMTLDPKVMSEFSGSGKLSGGFLGALAGAVLPMVLGKLMGNGLAGGAHICECESKKKCKCDELEDEEESLSDEEVEDEDDYRGSTRELDDDLRSQLNSLSSSSSYSDDEDDDSLDYFKRLASED